MRSLLVRTLIGILLCASAAVAVRGAQSILVSGDGLPARETTPPPTGTGLIMGRTVDADSGRPISGATVNLFRAGSTGYEPVMTDAQGRFVFSSLGAGTLTLRANKPGYLDGAYAKVLPSDQIDSGQPLDLADDERLGELTIKLWKYAVVGGTVLDETGEPMVGVAVRAMPKKFIGGRPQFSIERVAGSTARTDDRGQFRLSTLAPGDYVFVVPVITTTYPRSFLPPATTSQRSANYTESSGSLSTWLGGSSSGGSGGSTSIGDDRFTVLDSSNRPNTIGIPPSIAGVAANGTVLAYETTFHPASNALARAAVVTLRSGEERGGIDFRMRPVPSVRVSGTLMGPDGPAGEFVLRLVQTEISAVTTSDPEVAQTVTEPDGRFAFYGVPPGQYQIRGLKMPRPPSGLTLTDSSTSIRTGGGGGGSLTIIESARGTALPNLPTLWADTPVVVGDRNVDEAIVTLQTGFRIRGRVEFQGAAQKPSTPSLSIYVERADGAGSSNSSLAIGRTDEQGQFATQGQRPGKYYVRLPYAPAGWYFKSAMLGTSDISAVPIDLSRDIEGVVITLSDKPATRLAGLVTDPKGQPQLAGMVVVFTANQQVWGNSGQTARNIISTGVGKGGRYTVTNLPPGDYFVVALGEAVAGWADPKLLASWSRTAARVTLADGDVKTQDVRATTTPARDPSPLHEPDDAVEGHGPFVIEPLEEVEVDDQTPAPAQTRDVRPPAVGTAVIAGVVVSDDKARQPIRKAHVTLTAAVFGSHVITTDETGRFEFTHLPAGRFELSASKAAYLAANYGAKEPGRQGTIITLTDAQRLADITLTMARGAVITGIIRDQAGQPVPGVTVQAMQYRLVNGVRQIGALSSLAGGRAETDDRGQYRFFGLTGGEYVIGAAPRFNAGAARQIVEADVQAATQALTRTSSPVASAGRGTAAQPGPLSRGRSFSYAPVFFPGTTIAADATTVIVAKNEEKAGVDMALQLVPTALLEGVVTNPSGPLPSNLEVRLVAVSRVGPTPLDIGALIPVRPRADGKFSYTGVAPGQYAVVALAPAAQAGRGAAAPAGPATSLWATIEVNVNGVDVNGIALSLQPGMTVSGKVTADAKTLTPPSDFTGTRVSLQAILTGSQVSAGSLTATVNADGSFVLKGIMPGRYKITSTLGSGGVATGGVGAGWMLRSAMVGGRDATEEPFEVPGGTDVGDIVITFTDRPSEVSGVLQDATGRPATDYFIIVFPADRALWSAGARRVSQARPASDGRFTVRTLKAGSYLIAAVTDVESGATSDPDFLEQLVAGAVKFELAEGEKKVQDIRIAKW